MDTLVYRVGPDKHHGTQDEPANPLLHSFILKYKC